MNDKQEGILFTIDCLNSHKYNFDYNLEELIKEAKKLQANWSVLREELYQVNRELVTNELVNGKELINNIIEIMNELENGEIKNENKY